eukprot:Amastigsp_a1451_35.p3 type:complete len:172 gc:universal Amastigsp_a1451_35:1053-1568(+)
MTSATFPMISSYATPFALSHSIQRLSFGCSASFEGFAHNAPSRATSPVESIFTRVHRSEICLAASHFCAISGSRCLETIVDGSTARDTTTLRKHTSNARTEASMNGKRRASTSSTLSAAASPRVHARTRQQKSDASAAAIASWFDLNGASAAAIARAVRRPRLGSARSDIK